MRGCGFQRGQGGCPRMRRGVNGGLVNWVIEWADDQKCVCCRMVMRILSARRLVYQFL